LKIFLFFLFSSFELHSFVKKWMCGHIFWFPYILAFRDLRKSFVNLIIHLSMCVLRLNTGPKEVLGKWR
jgi:hypothetical protein